MLSIKNIKENKVSKNKELNKRIKKWAIISVCNFIILGIGLLFFLLGYLGKIIKINYLTKTWHHKHISFKNADGFRNWNIHKWYIYNHYAHPVSAHVLIVIGLFFLSIFFLYIVLFVLYWFSLWVGISILEINKENNKKI